MDDLEDRGSTLLQTLVCIMYIRGQFQNRPLIGCLRKMQNSEQNFIIWISYIHNCITSRHSFHPHLGTCHTVTLVFVVPRQRTVPPIYASKSLSCFSTHRAQSVW